MEVILRKTKITKSIVAQALQGRDELYTNNFNYDILGWCLITGKRNERWILLYDRIKNTLVRLPYAQKLSESEEVKSRNEQTDDGQGGYIYPQVFRLYTYLIDQHRTYQIAVSKEENEITSKKEKLHEFLTTVNEKGQIYV